MFSSIFNCSVVPWCVLISMQLMSVEDSWVMPAACEVGSTSLVSRGCIVMLQTAVSAVLALSTVLIEIAFPNLFASALVLVLVDLLLGRISCGGVFFLSTFLAGGVCGDCVLFWPIDSSDDIEIDVSHSNSIGVLSLRIFSGLPFPVRLGDLRLLLAVGFCLEVWGCLLRVASVALWMRCGPNDLRFLVFGWLSFGAHRCWWFCTVISCFLANGWEYICPGQLERVGFVWSNPAAEIRGLALGKCLYATKSFSCAGLQFPYTRGSGTKARPSCFNTLGRFPSSRTQGVCVE